MEVFSHERAQFLAVLRPTSEEAFASGQKVFELFVILIVQNLLLEKLPQPFDQIQIRRITRQIMQHDLRSLQFFLQPFRNVIARVVHDDMNRVHVRVFRLADRRWTRTVTVILHFVKQRVRRPRTWRVRR